MTTTPLDARSRVLDTATTALDARARADVELLMAAAEWAELHPAPAGSVDGYAGWGEDHLFDEGLTPLAGPGAPLVAEFAPCELAAVLGWTTLAAKQLMADAVELKHRLPRLWDLVGDLTVPVALARHVAQHTTDLCPDAAREADKLICTEPMRVSRVQVERLVDQVRLYFDPDRAVAEEQAALAARRVELRPGRTPATTEIQMSLDTLHAQAFDKTVADVAEALRRLGDCDDLDVRRARAVGVLADPQSALDLLTDGAVPSRRPASAVLFLHLSDAAVVGASGTDTAAWPVTEERLGAATSELIRQWLADATVILRPVLHLDRADAVDAHDPPEWMATLVRLRDGHCVFPGCQVPSSRCDLDHIEAYVAPEGGGPPGQTHPGNLAPLCRHHHRAKTHGEWSYRRLPDGDYRWTTPTGRTLETIIAPRRPSSPR